MRALLCLCVAACSFEHGSVDMGGQRDGGQGDATREVDAAPLDAPAALCGSSMPRIEETFDAAPTCPLGITGGNASMMLSGGALQISTMSNSQFAYCNEPDLASWSGNGATVEVPSVMTGNNAWTSFQVLGPNFAITEKNDNLVFSDNSGNQVFSIITYNAAAMRWWRLRPQSGNVIAEYSADRVAWTMLGSHSGIGMIRVQVIAGTDGNASPSGASRFDNLVVCP